MLPSHPFGADSSAGFAHILLTVDISGFLSITQSAFLSNPTKVQSKFNREYLGINTVCVSFGSHPGSREEPGLLCAAEDELSG